MRFIAGRAVRPGVVLRHRLRQCEPRRQFAAAGCILDQAFLHIGQADPFDPFGRRVVTLETIKQQTEQAASRAAVRVRDPRRGRV